jgi:hypothetical protein
MMNRGLARRLEKLEVRCKPAPSWEFEISFIEPGTMAVVSKLTTRNGRDEGWYAPGHEPEERKMSADVLR